MPIDIKNVSKSYSKNRKTLKVLEDISFHVEDEEFICILGPSGCGKTTLIRLIAGFEDYDEGEILDHTGLINKPSIDRGFIFQQYSLFPWLNVIENVLFAIKLDRTPTKDDIKKAEDYLDMVDLLDFKESYPHELSGGMKQRVAIVRSLINDNSILLMDEPFSAVDVLNRRHLQEQLLKIQDKIKNIIIFVTHDVDEAVFLADKIIVLDKNPGRIKEIIDVNINHPRKRESKDVLDIVSHVEKLLGVLEDE